MHAHELWILLAAALFIGGCGGWLLGHWRAYQECCECCTCQDCAEPIIEDEDEWARPQRHDPLPYRPDLAPSLAGRRQTIVLEPGPTIYPELAALAQMPSHGSEIDAERPDTSTWLRTWRLEVEAAYPIPGTPQWEARQTAGVS